ncbi:MAG: hypothetical protein CBC35_06575 [Planctomycetes bacterium TMED75]|nr:hypothetical protein [Planctomycetaceae bacterium]OUU92870.1 MAG: hypothetical protein CBC35_06575 [Planctomycetes bacterium TMED75]
MSDERPLSGYCTNVHAGTTLEETIANLELHAVHVREELGEPTLGIGLWIPESVLTQLQTRSEVHSLRSHLERLGLFVYTMNGFPQRNFHAQVVKHGVYQPDWCTPERLEYTCRLAEILVDLAPNHLPELSISTLPVGWRSAITEIDPAIRRLTELAEFLAQLEERTGRLVHVDLEPEPGCWLDTARDVVRLFERLPESSRRHLRVCHDICHSAVMFEPQREAIETYRNAGIGIGKIQVSSCPEAKIGGSDQTTVEALKSFVEQRYLHQTVIRDESGVQHFHEDLDGVEFGSLEGMLRVHFHVPLFAESLGPLGTTQREIGECLKALGDEIPPLEVETYAWGVLPEPHRREELALGIARELHWLRTALDTYLG